MTRKRQSDGTSTVSAKKRREMINRNLNVLTQRQTDARENGALNNVTASCSTPSNIGNQTITHDCSSSESCSDSGVTQTVVNSGNTKSRCASRGSSNRKVRAARVRTTTYVSLIPSRSSNKQLSRISKQKGVKNRSVRSGKSVTCTRPISVNKRKTLRNTVTSRSGGCSKSTNISSLSTRGNASTTANRAEQYSDSCDIDQDCDHVQVLPVQKQVTAPSVPRLRIPTYLTESEPEEEIVMLPQPVREIDSENDLPNATRAHIDRLTGEQPQILNVQSPSFGESISVSISSQIPARMKRKIWSNKYIDFATLLPSYNIQPLQQKYTLQLENNSFNIVPETQTRKITHISQWTSAFLRFVAVYAEKFPNETAQLMKYGEVIRDLSNRGPGFSWYHYDMQFRQLRESISLRWDKIHYDLWVPAATYTFQGHMKPKRQFNQDITRENSYPFLGNVCWAFNRSGKCIKKDCKYIHECRGCRAPHPAIQCSLSQGSTGPINTRGAHGSITLTHHT